MVFVVTLSCVRFVLRAVRLHVLIPNEHQIRAAMACFSVGFLANLLAPLRLGLVARPVILKTLTETTLATGVLITATERLLDVAVLALLAAPLLPGNPLLTWLPWLAGACALLWGASRVLPKEHARQIQEAVHALTQRPRHASFAFLLTALDLGLLLVLLDRLFSQWAGVPHDLGTLLSFVLAIVGAMTFSPTPGGAGGYEAAGTMALVARGAPAPEAAAATLAARILAYGAFVGMSGLGVVLGGSAVREVLQRARAGETSDTPQ